MKRSAPVALLTWWVSASCVLMAAESLGTAPPERPITAEERDHWAYRPIATPAVPNLGAERIAENPIDCFLDAAMREQSIEPLPAASRSVLLRRVTLDLTGLPPAPEEVAEFVGDPSSNAYPKLVERLLASPAYGERWAQHWLDLARYAETDGFEHDLVRPNAWRYRDWVIDALNRDMPFDRFVRLQIAGDEIEPGDPDAAIATGFLLCGPDMPDLNLQEERRHQVLNEMTATVGSALLGMQFGCAQCHDHKFDPIRQHDFYRLRAYFESADVFREHPVPTVEQLAARRAAEAAADPAQRERTRRRDELEALGRDLFRQKNPDEQPTSKQLLGELSQENRGEHAALVKELRLAARLPELPMGRVMQDGESRESRLFLRGDFRQPGPIVTCGLPRVLTAATELPERPTKPREQLAAWLSGETNPLTARVIVNRLWQWHFGVGLAASTSDFGVMGSPPTHPELLDWLSRRFVAEGWSIKKLHSLIVTSKAYQRASGPFDAGWSAEQSQAAARAWRQSQAQDPQNALWWRRRRLRLDGETIRDAMLLAAGQLSRRRGGPGIRPPLSAEVTSTLLKDQWLVTGDEEDHRRRSIYLFVRRNLRYPMFDVFDRPDTNASCPQRHESTTATQSLVLMNSKFSLQCAQALAGALWHEQPSNPQAQIRAAHLRVFARVPNAEEIRLGLAFLNRQQELLREEQRTTQSLALASATAADDDPLASAALVDYCLALFNANEFVYVD